MKIQIISDIHCECHPFTFDSQPDVDVCVIAGDAGKVAEIDETLVLLLAEASREFRQVIYIAGNHEFHGYDMQEAKVLLKELCDSFGNVHFLNNGVKEIDDVVFIGATLWTNFDSCDPRLMMVTAVNHMPDLKKITQDDELITVKDVLREYTLSSMYLAEYMDLYERQEKKMVVVTHHAPSLKSIPEDFSIMDRVGLYANSLEDYIIDFNPDLWIHGHLHNSSDYEIKDTRVICNPRGSGQFMNEGFNPKLTVDI